MNSIQKDPKPISLDSSTNGHPSDVRQRYATPRFAGKRKPSSLVAIRNETVRRSRTGYLQRHGPHCIQRQSIEANQSETKSIQSNIRKIHRRRLQSAKCTRSWSIPHLRIHRRESTKSSGRRREETTVQRRCGTTLEHGSSRPIQYTRYETPHYPLSLPLRSLSLGPTSYDVKPQPPKTRIVHPTANFASTTNREPVIEVKPLIHRSTCLSLLVSSRLVGHSRADCLRRVACLSSADVSAPAAASLEERA